jgi:hypothetical protein
MNPVEVLLHKYREHRKGGGSRPDLSRFPHEAHVSERKISASGLCLCDREQYYRLQGDIGERDKPAENPPELEMDFWVGNIFEDIVAEALEHAGVLKMWQGRLTDGLIKGRPDVKTEPLADIDGDSRDWQIEVKTVKGTWAGALTQEKPSLWHVAQAEQYARMDPDPVRSLLLYASRSTFATELYAWDWEDGKCWGKRWVDGKWKRKQVPVRDMYKNENAWELIEQSIENQRLGLEDGILPPRCGEWPDQHPFKCIKTVKKGYKGKPKTVAPDCPFFNECWEVEVPDDITWLNTPGAWQETLEELGLSDSKPDPIW